jgi:hypothetical protein
MIKDCPICSSLQEKNKTLSDEWNYIKNIHLTPSDVTPGSHKKVWWKCDKGHEWEAVIKSRVEGNGCPYCSNHKVCEDNCLATVNARLALQWHPTKNGDLKPEHVLPGSGQKVWWKCEKGHEWLATINNRNKGNGCPECRKNRY